MQGITHTAARLIETSMSGGVNRTAGDSVANLLYEFESLRSPNPLFYPMQGTLNIQLDGRLRHRRLME